MCKKAMWDPSGRLPLFLMDGFGTKHRRLVSKVGNYISNVYIVTTGSVNLSILIGDIVLFIRTLFRSHVQLQL